MSTHAHSKEVVEPPQTGSTAQQSGTQTRGEMSSTRASISEGVPFNFWFHRAWDGDLQASV